MKTEWTHLRRKKDKTRDKKRREKKEREQEQDQEDSPFSRSEESEGVQVRGTEEYTPGIPTSM